MQDRGRRQARRLSLRLAPPLPLPAAANIPRPAQWIKPLTMSPRPRRTRSGRCKVSLPLRKRRKARKRKLARATIA